MPRNGSGTFARNDGTYSGEEIWANNRDADIKIIASAHDEHDQDIADALTASLAKDGQTTPTASLPMGGYRHTNVGVASARTDYARASQVQDNGFNYGSCSSSSNVYTLTMAPAVTAYVTGMEVSFKADATSSGAITVKLNALAAKKLYRAGGTVQATTGDLRQDKYYKLAYDAALDSATGGFVLLGEGRSTITYTPVLGASGAMTYIATTTYADFVDEGDFVTVQVKGSGTTGNSGADSLTIQLPFTAAAIAQSCGVGTVVDTGTTMGYVAIDSGASVAKVYKYDRTNFGLGASRAFEVTFRYRRA